MKYLNSWLIVLLIVGGCTTSPRPDAFPSMWRRARPLDITGVEEERRIEIVLPKSEIAILILRDSPVTSVGVQYPDEQSPNEGLEHEILGIVGDGSIHEVRISEDKRFVLIKGEVAAYSSRGPEQPVTVLSIYDLKHRNSLDSIDIGR